MLGAGPSRGRAELGQSDGIPGAVLRDLHLALPLVRAADWRPWGAYGLVHSWLELALSSFPRSGI